MQVIVVTLALHLRTIEHFKTNWLSGNDWLSMLMLLAVYLTLRQSQLAPSNCQNVRSLILYCYCCYSSNYYCCCDWVLSQICHQLLRTVQDSVDQRHPTANNSIWLCFRYATNIIRCDRIRYGALDHVTPYHFNLCVTVAFFCPKWKWSKIWLCLFFFWKMIFPFIDWLMEIFKVKNDRLQFVPVKYLLICVLFSALYGK